MARREVVAAVTSRLQDNWSENAIPIILPNDANSQPPADGSPFLSVQFPVGTATIVSMAAPGSRTIREEGAIRLVLSARRGDGLDAALGLLEEAAALFRLQDVPTANGGLVRCLEASPPIDNDSSDNGAYWVMSTSVRYYFDYFV